MLIVVPTRIASYTSSALVLEKSVLNLPSNQVLGLSAEMDIIREEQVFSPIDDFSVDIVRVLGTERWVSWIIRGCTSQPSGEDGPLTNETLKHDSTE